MVVTTLKEAELKRMAVAHEKKRGYKVHLILPVTHQGAVITVTEVHDTATTRGGGNKMYPILAEVWVYFADTNWKNGKTLPGHHLGFWDSEPIIGTTRTPAEYTKAIETAKKKAYEIAHKIALNGYKY